METIPKRMPRWLIPAFVTAAIIGCADALYLTIEHYMHLKTVCLIVNGCDRVLESSYATIIYNIPTAFLGVLYYGTLIGLVIKYYRTNDERALRRAGTATIVGFTASLWFVYLQLFVIKAICFYCMISALSSTTLFLLGIIGLTWLGRRSTAPPALGL